MAVPVELYRDCSDRLCVHLQEFLQDQLTVGQTVLAYQPHRQEPDLQGLFARADYRWALPRCLPHRQLAWHLWQPDEALVTNSYGLAEPLATATSVEPIDAGSIGALLIPMVGFDVDGYRLGYGGGYFDRLLASAGWDKILKIGIAFDLAMVPKIPIDPWDLPLPRICTQSGMVVDLS
jgi:5-formyltetrahydrofolate cyclo-ligase